MADAMGRYNDWDYSVLFYIFYEEFATTGGKRL